MKMIIKPFIKTNINIVNLKNHIPTEYDFYIGRPSILGNPYTHNTNSKYAKYIVGSRNEAISKYEQYLEDNKDNEEFKNAFNIMVELYKTHKALNLCCWCYPKPCHGKYIKNFLEKHYLMK